MELTPARPDDHLPIVELLAGCGLPTQDIALSHLNHFWVVRDGCQLAGVVGLEIHGRSALLRSLAVSAERRRKGIGTRLTTQAEAYARSRSVTVIYLLTTTQSSFFAGRGYQLRERSQAPAGIRNSAEFRTLCPAGAACMSKDLEVADPSAQHPGAP